MPDDSLSSPLPPADPAEIELVKVLKDDGFAETHLVTYQGQRWLRKIYRFRFWWGRLADRWARKQARHEMAICRLLDDIDGTATRYIPVDERSFLREWVEGMDLRERNRIGHRPGNEFFAELRAIVEQVHAKGVAYNDLAKQDNVVVTEDDRPILIDFQISMQAYQGRNPLRRAFNRWLMDRLCQEDLRHVAKLKRRVRPDLLTDEERELSYRKPLAGRIARKLLSEPLRNFKRLFYPSGSNETFRFGRKKK